MTCMHVSKSLCSSRPLGQAIIGPFLSWLVLLLALSQAGFSCGILYAWHLVLNFWSSWTKVCPGSIFSFRAEAHISVLLWLV